MQFRFAILIWVLGVGVSLANDLADVPKQARYDRAADRHPYTVYMREGGWCWFQDPRAIIHSGHLIIGSVQGNGSGPALVGVYDLRQQKSLGSVTMHDDFDRDDHNSPVFYRRPDGALLAMYARHAREKLHYYRISHAKDFTQWGPERQIDHSEFMPAASDNVTYMNLHSVDTEGRLYCFFRGLDFNPCLVASEDHGLTWGKAKQFIKSELQGRHRPYVRYACDGSDRIHISFTDGHPRNFGNSIYYAAFKDGKFYATDGRLIKGLAIDGPLFPSEAECVYQGGGEFGLAEHGASAAKSAWTSSMAIDERGHPHIGYSLHLANDDHRYRIATWDGQRWIDREVAYAGTCLYEDESSYTGLITLDPVDPTCVVISTDVDPQTGKSLGGRHEIYRGRVESDDDVSTVRWEAITANSPVRNIRPLVLRDGSTRYVLWNRGEYKTYTNYQLDTVGIEETVEVASQGRAPNSAILRRE